MTFVDNNSKGKGAKQVNVKISVFSKIILSAHITGNNYS